MKKSLLFAATLFATVAVNAQTVVWPCETASDDGKNITADQYAAAIHGTVTGSTTITVSDVAPGAGIIAPATACQKSWKDASGTSTAYGSDETPAIVKWAPTATSDATPKTIEDGAAASQYVDFKIEEGDINKVLSLSSVSFDAVRLGTDAVRINVKLLAEGDSEYESDYLINAENWASVSDGVGSWVESTGAEGEILGCQPSREDASKPNSANGKTSYTIPVPADFPASAYSATLRIFVYGIASNKALGLHNVKFNLGGGAGINGVTVDKANANAPVYNLAGQRVNDSFKGIAIQNGKKIVK